MTVSSPQISKPDSPVKRTLDHLELVEKIPALTRANGRDLPRHPAVIAFLNECAAIKRPGANKIGIARRNLRDAVLNYKQRCDLRFQPGIEWSDGGAGVALSGIIEARATARHWYKELRRLEAAKKIREQQEQNRRHIIRHRLRSMGLTA